VAAKGLSWSQMNEANWTSFTRKLAERRAIRNLPNAVGAPFTVLESLPLRTIYGSGAPGSCSTVAAPRSMMPASSSSSSSTKRPLHSVAIESTMGSKAAKQFTVSAPPCAPAASVAIYTVSFGLREVGYGDLVPKRAEHHQLFEEFVQMRRAKNLPRPHVLEVARPFEHPFHILLAKILRAADILPVNVEIIPVDCRQFTDAQRKHGHNDRQNHIGYSGQVMAGVKRSGDFRHFWARLAQQIEGKRSERVALAFYCNRGRHRSVACSLMMDEIAQRQPGFVWFGGLHASASGWAHGTCNLCQQCREDATGERKAALAAAWDAWRAAEPVVSRILAR